MWVINPLLTWTSGVTVHQIKYYQSINSVSSFLTSLWGICDAACACSFNWSLFYHVIWHRVSYLPTDVNKHRSGRGYLWIAICKGHQFEFIRWRQKLRGSKKIGPYLIEWHKKISCIRNKGKLHVSKVECLWKTMWYACSMQDG